MINTRGTRYSREHSFLDPDFDEEYWNYTFQEIGEYDIRAATDFIQSKKPNEPKIDVVAYSQGTTASFYAMA